MAVLVMRVALGMRKERSPPCLHAHILFSGALLLQFLLNIKSEGTKKEVDRNPRDLLSGQSLSCAQK
jgi:hypothetical protein